MAFVVLTVAYSFCGLFLAPRSGSPANIDPGHAPPVAVALAFPVAMALATGIEAPSSAIAQLGELDDPDRRRFGRITLWLTLLVVGTLTLGLTAETVHLNIGVPPNDSTQIAELARVATAPALFAAFQLATALLLLSAARVAVDAESGRQLALGLAVLRRQRHEHRIGPGFHADAAHPALKLAGDVRGLEQKRDALVERGNAGRTVLHTAQTSTSTDYHL